MVGLQPLKEKSINIGKRATVAFTIVVGLAIVLSSAYYAFLNIQNQWTKVSWQKNSM